LFNPSRKLIHLSGERLNGVGGLGIVENRFNLATKAGEAGGNLLEGSGLFAFGEREDCPNEEPGEVSSFASGRVNDGLGVSGMSAGGDAVGEGMGVRYAGGRVGFSHFLWSAFSIQPPRA
jgi:hypothetical protein